MSTIKKIPAFKTKEVSRRVRIPVLMVLLFKYTLVSIFTAAFIEFALWRLLTNKSGTASLFLSELKEKKKY